ncbi:Uncharacterised protein [Mycobacteroides abscessus subsp. abscessus]|nr:Uncharacterised protein [Mycobacteroides abscessus subsp. abscessus]
MPAMSNTPTAASNPAAVVAGMPWSWADGMKWMPTRPLVVAPQIANARASAQKARCRAAKTRPSTARRTAPPPVRGAAT